MKTFKLLARFKKNGKLKVDKEIDDNINPLEIIGIYEFIKNKYLGQRTGMIALQIMINDNGIATRIKIFPLVPLGEDTFDIGSLMDTLKKEEMENIVKKLGITKNE